MNQMNDQDLHIPPAAVALAYVLSPTHDAVLMAHHLTDTIDPSFGRLNGCDAVIEGHETPAAAARRAIRTLTGLEPTVLVPRGVVHWSGYGDEQRGLMGFVFLCTAYQGLQRRDGPEIRLRWVPLDELLETQQWPLWPGDHHILPLAFDYDPRPFFGVMPYHNGVPCGWSFERLPIGARSSQMDGSDPLLTEEPED